MRDAELARLAMEQWLNDGSCDSFIRVAVTCYNEGRKAGLREAEVECRDRIGAHLQPFERNSGANFALNEVADRLQALRERSQ